MDPKLAAIYEAVLEGDKPGAKAAIQPQWPRSASA